MYAPAPFTFGAWHARAKCNLASGRPSLRSATPALPKKTDIPVAVSSVQVCKCVSGMRLRAICKSSETNITPSYARNRIKSNHYDLASDCANRKQETAGNQCKQAIRMKMNLQKTRIPVKSKLEYRVAKGTSRLSERKLERKEALYVTEQLIALLQDVKLEWDTANLAVSRPTGRQTLPSMGTAWKKDAASSIRSCPWNVCAIEVTTTSANDNRVRPHRVQFLCTVLYSGIGKCSWKARVGVDFCVQANSIRESH
ncbi:hypothetical protein AXG93_977s1210 [Marchantia polymorpha subsp. ruderalis]|uniref:Uncharacterized protein n=1 Tax=Marchantia polymorpha subsp. ruderalis TaxID=1480154 RepID=A0A176WE41_MARPO|nr:hypothetical protein AXG93_977s1210 [Marchantia polymorpha subsp. ruderalis]